MKDDLEKMISKDLKIAYEKALEATAEQIGYEIENAYESAIDRFYDDYDPTWYDRTYSTYLASEAYNGSKYHNAGDAFIAGTIIDASFIPGDPYRADKEWVFKRTFEKGYHGYSYNDRMKIMKYTKDNDEYKKYRDLFFKLKRKRNKRFLNGNFHKGKKFWITKNKYYIEPIKKMPRGTEPIKNMNRTFRKITKKDRIDSIFTENLNRYLT